MTLRKTSIVLLTIILIINILVSYSFHNASLYEQGVKNAKERLNEMASFGYYLFDNKLEEQIHSVNDSAAAFGVLDDLQGDIVQQLLVSSATQNQLLRSAIAFPNGDFITSDNQVGNVLGQEFFETALRGEFHISDPTPAVVDKTKKVLLLTSPIVHNEKVVATLTFSYLCDELEEIFDLTLLNENAHTIITNTKGDVLIGGITNNKQYKNIFSYMNEKSKDTKSKDISSFDNDTGTFDIESKASGQSFLAKYTRLSTKEWYAITLVNKQYTMETIDAMAGLRQDWNIYLLVSFFLYILMVSVLVRAHIKNVDKLTRLLSFDAFKKEAAKRLEKQKNQDFIIIKLDIRGFKLINRVYGFDTGNDVIINMAAALKETLKDHKSLTTRVSIDNFVLLLPYSNAHEVGKLRSIFVSTFRQLMGSDFIDNIDFPTGQYIASGDTRSVDNIDDIYEKVNFAHQMAKQSDLNLIVDYDAAVEKHAIYQKDLEDRMHTALLNKEFHLFIQPKVCLHQEKVCSGEALIRWIEKDGNILPPGKFLPLFEKNGFIVHLDKYMFEKVAQMLREQMDEGKEVYPISVNFSRLHLHNEKLVEELCTIADTYRVPHHLLEVELTESIVFDNIDIIISLIDQLHENGFTISIDDFGAGYSSLSLLKGVRVDVVKLDRSFFSTTQREERSDVVIKNILRMTKELNIKTVAEGIETCDYVDFLKECHCDMIQGYYYSKPISQKEYEEKYFSFNDVDDIE